MIIVAAIQMIFQPRPEAMICWYDPFNSQCFLWVHPLQGLLIWAGKVNLWCGALLESLFGSLSVGVFCFTSSTEDYFNAWHFILVFCNRNNLCFNRHALGNSHGGIRGSYDDASPCPSQSCRMGNDGAFWHLLSFDTKSCRHFARKDTFCRSNIGVDCICTWHCSGK